MAWLEQRGAQFHLGIRLGNRKLKRSLQTNDQQEAEQIASRVERRLKLIEQGDLSVPQDADLFTFLVTDGKLTQPLELKPAETLSSVCAQYLKSLPQGSIEENSLYTLNIHLTHIRTVLGNDFAVEKLKFNDLQRYVETRSKEKGRRGQPLSPITIKKELTSFSGMWSWAIRSNIVKGAFPNKGLRYSKTAEKPPFQTWEEIERQIEHGALSEIEQNELWDGLYLTAAEIEQVLDFVRENATWPAIYPMMTIAAHTGARRSEILRIEIGDFDMKARTVRLRELKRARGKRTLRTVPMSGRLYSALQEWLAVQKGRQPFLLRGRRPTVDDASHQFDLALAGSKWEKIRGWHVFRHSFISNCASRGIDQRMIDAWSGHQTEEMRKRYRHLFPTVQQEALQSVFGS